MKAEQKRFGSFGKLLQRLRLDRGYKSASELAEHMDLSKAAVNSWEGGYYLPSSGNIIRLKKLLNLSEYEMTKLVQEIESADLDPLKRPLIKSDEEIEEIFSRVKEIRQHPKRIKVLLSLDEDVFEWFKEYGGQHTKHMGRVLAAYARHKEDSRLIRR